MKTEKNALRRQFRLARKSLTPHERRAATRVIVCRLRPFIKRGKRIALYCAVGSELDLRALIATAKQRQAQVFVPYIERGKRELWFTPLQNLKQRERGDASGFGIPQFAGKKLRAKWLNVMFLPLVGADKNGYRLGQGGGFYDATLARAQHGKPLKVGTAFACQICDNLPHEAHDIRLDYLISEDFVGDFRHKK